MQLSLFDTNSNQEDLRYIDVEQLFEAYFSCRKTKRYTQNALKFEVDYEENLFQLKEEIESGNYYPARSIAFIVNNPLKEKYLRLILKIELCIIGLSINSIPFLNIFLYKIVMLVV